MSGTPKSDSVKDRGITRMDILKYQRQLIREATRPSLVGDAMRAIFKLAGEPPSSVCVGP